MTKHRIKHIDIARAFAIILVVCSHCDNFHVWSIEKFSNLFFMPLFIYISGCLYKEFDDIDFKTFINIVWKRIKHIYYIYIKYEVLFLILENLFIKIGFYSFDESYGEKLLPSVSSFSLFIKKIVLIIFGMGTEPFCGAFWFLVTLIFVIIIFSSICYIAKKQKKIPEYVFEFILVLFFFATGCLMSKTYSIPRLSPAFTMVIFYYLGHINSKNKYIKFNNIFVALLSLCLLFILNNHGFVSINTNHFTNPIYLLVTSFAGIYCVFSISIFIENNIKILSNIFSYIGQRTEYIIAYHFISYKVVMIIQYICGYINYNDIAKLTGYNNNNIWYMAYVAVGVILPLVIEAIKDNILNRNKIRRI